MHATPQHPERFDYLVDAEQALDAAQMLRTPYCLLGHTHVPWFAEYDRDSRRLTRVVTQAGALREVRLPAERERFRCIMNPGSVGQPRDGDPRASAAVLDAGAGTFAVRRVVYDVAEAQRKIRGAELPAFLADRLAAGH